MHRIDTPTAQEGKFGAGKNGFTAGDPTLGVPATQLDDAFFDSIQEEVCAVIETAGIALQKGVRTQLVTAIDQLITKKTDLALLIANNLKDVKDPAGALANLNGVPRTTTVNGHPLTGNVAVTHQDIFGAPTQLGNGVDLNTITKPGLYFQPANAATQDGANYPELNAGSLIVTRHAGTSQLYIIYITGVIYSRGLYNNSWSPWRRTADGNGDTFTGEMKFWARPNTMRVGDAEYALIFRRSENHIHFIPTSKGAGLNGDLSALRPLSIDLSTGTVQMGNGLGVTGRVTPSDYTNFDGRYYTRQQSDTAYMPKTGAYTKQESDSRYPAAANVYAKAASDSRYVMGVRLGAAVQIHPLTLTNVPAGHVMASADFNQHNSPKDVIAYVKPIQALINNAWVTITG